MSVNIRYNIKALEHIIEDLACLTGVSIAFLDTDFNCLSMCAKKDDYCSVLQNKVLPEDYCKKCDMKLLKRCKQSRKLETHTCHAGLCDSAMPIIKNEIIAGYIIFGRVKTKKSPKVQIYNTENINELLSEKYSQLTFWGEEQINSFSSIISAAPAFFKIIALWN